MPLIPTICSWQLQLTTLCWLLKDACVGMQVVAFEKASLLQTKDQQECRREADRSKAFADAITHTVSLLHAVCLQHLRGDWDLGNLCAHEPDGAPPPMVSSMRHFDATLAILSGPLGLLSVLLISWYAEKQYMSSSCTALVAAGAHQPSKPRCMLMGSSLQLRHWLCLLDSIAHV